MEPAALARPPDAPDAPASTLHGELPPLPAPPAALAGFDRPPLAPDRGAALDALVERTLTGVQREGAWRSVARGVGVLLGAVLALRVIFDAVLPVLLVVALVGAVLVAGLALGLHAAAEARRQRALLLALAQLSRMARLDPAMRERVAPQIDAVVDALRARPGLWPSARKEP